MSTERSILPRRWPTQKRSCARSPIPWHRPLSGAMKWAPPQPYAQQLLESAVEALDADLHDWRLTLSELRIADEALESIAATLVAGGDARTVLEHCAAPRTAELRTERAQADARQAVLRPGVALRDARDRVTEVEGQREPEPAPALGAPRIAGGSSGRTAVGGVRLPAPPRSRRRSRRVGSRPRGCRWPNAPITPDGTIHDADLTLLAVEDGPSAGAEHGTLADLLAPDRTDARVDYAIIAAVLRSIPLQGPLKERGAWPVSLWRVARSRAQARARVHRRKRPCGRSRAVTPGSTRRCHGPRIAGRCPHLGGST